MDRREINPGDIVLRYDDLTRTKRPHLILKKHDIYAASIRLEPKKYDSNAKPILIDGMYGDAGKLGWVYFNEIVEIAGTITPEELKAVKQQIVRAVGLTGVMDGGEAVAELEHTVDLMGKQINEDTRTIEDLRTSVQFYQKFYAEAMEAKEDLENFLRDRARTKARIKESQRKPCFLSWLRRKEA